MLTRRLCRRLRTHLLRPCQFPHWVQFQAPSVHQDLNQNLTCIVRGLYDQVALGGQGRTYLLILDSDRVANRDGCKEELGGHDACKCQIFGGQFVSIFHWYSPFRLDHPLAAVLLQKGALLTILNWTFGWFRRA